MEFLIAYGYIGVFIASFLAATVLPFSSEVVLTGVLLAGSSYWACMIAATLGNFLGGMSCYWLGMLGKTEWIEKYLKLDSAKLERVQNWIKGKGSWIGFFVFLPGIGDFIDLGNDLRRIASAVAAQAVVHVHLVFIQHKDAFFRLFFRL